MSQSQVEAYLLAHPGEHTHFEIAKALGMEPTTTQNNLWNLRRRWKAVKSRRAPELQKQGQTPVVWWIDQVIEP